VTTDRARELWRVFARLGAARERRGRRRGAKGEVNAALERDTYMTASEAKKFGIVDHTVTRITEIEGLDLDKGNGKK